MKLYHELSEYYFSIEENHRNIDDDLELILELLANKTNPSLLDLGCGTGEHLNELYRRGIHCTGLDNSKDMLTHAGLRFPGTAEYVEGSMADFDYFEEFDMVISLFGSFNYMLEDSQVDNVFWNTWRALKPGGQGLFEIWNAIPIREIKEKDMDVVSKTNYMNTEIQRERGFNLLNYPARTIVQVNYRYRVIENGQEHEVRDKHTMRAFNRNEITRFIRDNGFSIKSMYANSRKEPYTDYSNRILIHFIKE